MIFDQVDAHRAPRTTAPELGRISATEIECFPLVENVLIQVEIPDIAADIRNTLVHIGVDVVVKAESFSLLTGYATWRMGNLLRVVIVEDKIVSERHVGN